MLFLNIHKRSVMNPHVCDGYETDQLIICIDLFRWFMQTYLLQVSDLSFLPLELLKLRALLLESGSVKADRLN